MTDASLHDLAETVLRRAADGGFGVIVAESCTAGLLCQTLSDAKGAAAHFHGGFVTYTKTHKVAALEISRHLLRHRSAVCGEVARAMAEGALRHSTADMAVAITGVAGPEPDEDGNPVGRVCIAVARHGAAPGEIDLHDIERNYGAIGREAIRKEAVRDALALLAKAIPLPVAA